MAKPKKSYYVVVRVVFDKPVLKKDALKMAQETLPARYFPHDPAWNEVCQMDVKSVRSSLPYPKRCVDDWGRW